MHVTARLLWVTGCRLNEIFARDLSDIEDRGDHIVITIPESKTEAGKRTVMVVGKEDQEMLRDAMRRALIDTPASPERKGSLFPRIAPGGFNGAPGHTLSRNLQNVRKWSGASPEEICAKVGDA
jgi:Phage integrase family.